MSYVTRMEAAIRLLFPAALAGGKSKGQAWHPLRPTDTPAATTAMFSTATPPPSQPPLPHRAQQAYHYATLPPHAPAVIVTNTTTLHDPSSIACFSHAHRHRDFHSLVKKYVHQLLYGCARPVCNTPTCATCRRGLNAAAAAGDGPAPLGSRREFTPLSARIIACQLATADEPYRGLCPGVAGEFRRRAELGSTTAGEGPVAAGKVDIGMRDSKSFMQGLFNTAAVRSLETNVLPPPMDVVNVISSRRGESARRPAAAAAATTTEELAGDLSDEAELAFNPKHRVFSAALSRLESETRKDSTNAASAAATTKAATNTTAAGDAPGANTTAAERDRTSLATPPYNAHARPPFQVSQQSGKASRRKLSHDLSSYLTSPKNTFFTPDVNELAPPHLLRPPPRDLTTQRRSPETTPSRTAKPATDERSANGTAGAAPAGAKGTVLLPQAVTHLTLDIVAALLGMVDDGAASASARREAEGFLRQSCYYVFGSPESLAACFPEDAKAGKSVGVLRSVKALFDRGVGGEIVDALWKALGELFPTVEEVVVDGETRKAIRPAKVPVETAVRVFILTMHVITAACPVASPEVWERCRRDRSRGTVCLDVPFEDEGLLRLVGRFARCWHAYGLFEPTVKDAVREYLLGYAKIERKERADKLESELGRDLAGDVVNSGVGKGGWGLIVCSLEWMRAMMLREWDGSERPRTGGVVDASIQFLRFLCECSSNPGFRRVLIRSTIDDDHEALGLEESYFHNQVLADRLEYKDMPVKWYLRKPKNANPDSPDGPAARRSLEPPHLLNAAFLLPPAALVKFFRSINFYRMSAAYDDALAMYRFVNQMADVTRLDLYKSWLRNYIMASYDIAMTVYLLIEVHRTSVVKDTLDQLVGRELRECLRPLKVRFLDVGEEGVDHGGVQQEYFRLLWEEVTRGEYGCFTTDERTRISWFSIVTLEPMHKFELLGLLVGLAVYNGVTLPVSFPLVVYRKLLGWRIELDDLADGWPELVKGMRQLLEWKEEDGDVADVFVRSYEFGYEGFGEVHHVDLMRVGREDRWAPVTVEKKMVKDPDVAWLRGSVARQFRAVSHTPPQLTIAALAGTAATNHEGDEVDEAADASSSSGSSGASSAVHIPAENQLQVPDSADSTSSDSSSRRVLTPGSPSPSSSPSRRNSAVVIDENDEAAATWKAYDKQQQQQQSLSSAHSNCSSTSPVKITSERFVRPEGEEAELVTNANRRQYVRDYVFWLTDKSVRPQFEAFERGFHAVLDRKSLSLFNPATLRHLVEGSKEIDIAALEAAAKYDDGYHPNHRVIKDFWAIVRTYDNDQRRALLEFVTASDRVPVSGIASVMFVVQRNGGDSERVPTSLTCFGRLLLPEYSGRKKMREKLRVALENGRGFGVP
ncbi:Ubiquitin-protein ligase [Drechslerella dactyloides]|uniref:HECT-type E3 ubiquitin transferase n=1 Tax=Drechslerella dactyloides TaxID=74499 RepID=A0AAD6IPW5_DREDA|nr:Ubiquitin-protein ligase [Drechslerella dactyloides]